MTDRLQQKKAAEIVREQLGYQVPASLESMRVDHPYEYKCALAGLTAGIAMAAPEELRKLSAQATQGDWRYENYDVDSYEIMGPKEIHIAFLPSTGREPVANRKFIVACVNYVRRVLAKGETQHG